MVPRLAWRNLLPGIIATAILIAATIAVLAYGGIGRIPGDKIRLYVVTSSARGVMKGTEVWIAGQRVGTVEDISFRPVTADSSRVVLGIRVREADADQIRRDSEIRVQSGANVVGPLVVYITGGTPRSASVRNGDTLFAQTQSDLAATGARFQEALKQMGPVMADVRVIMAQARNPNSTVGAFRAQGDNGQVTRLRSQVGRLRAQLSPSGGQPARARLMSSAQGLMAQVDSVRALLASDNSSLGRFRRDSTLGRTIAGVRDELAMLRSRLDSSDGTLGRLQNDSSVTRALADAQREMALLFEDIKKRPVRYIAF
jgi:phospholipid/cholesterol/gamma-HCH transport system substrate-binding protein